MTTVPDSSAGVHPVALLEHLRSRRVARDFGPEPVEDSQLWMILEAGRWATSASNNRVHRLLVVRDRSQIKLVADMSPGIYSLPAAMVVICTDLRLVAEAQVQPDDQHVFIDAGTLMMNMMSQAHALGLGTCPATSFSRAGVAVILGLPPHARPDIILQVGHASSPPRKERPGQSRPSPFLAQLVHWDAYGRTHPLPQAGEAQLCRAKVADHCSGTGRVAARLVLEAALSHHVKRLNIAAENSPCKEPRTHSLGPWYRGWNGCAAMTPQLWKSSDQALGMS